MTRTMHGWHIPGTTYDDEKFMRAVDSCGGITNCLHCAAECGTIKRVKDNHILLDVDNPAAAYNHLMLLRNLVIDRYGVDRGGLEITFIENLLKQIEEETD